MIIDGLSIAQKIQEEITKTVSTIKGRKPHLAVIQIGNHPASTLYIRRKRKACADVGILSTISHLSENASESEVIDAINHLNRNHDVDGILIQLPLPPQMRVIKIMQSINPNKDVDGFHPTNIGKLLIGDTSGYVPCTPLGVKELLDHTKISIPGKHVVIVGRSSIVGKPLAALLMQNAPGLNATVTVAHSQSVNLQQLTLSADILVAAVGKQNCITADMVQEGAVVIDVGINQKEDSSKRSGYRLIGDVDFEAVSAKSSFITPVPGGVGPMTIAMLLRNTLLSYTRSCGL